MGTFVSIFLKIVKNFGAKINIFFVFLAHIDKNDKNSLDGFIFQGREEEEENFMIFFEKDFVQSYLVSMVKN